MSKTWGYPQIGSRYDGPPLDRPCLRSMPREWSLTVEPDTYGDTAVMIACAVAAVFAAVSVAWGIL